MYLSVFLKWLGGREITNQLVEQFFTHLRLEREVTNHSTLNSYFSSLFCLQDYYNDRGIKNDFMRGFSYEKRIKHNTAILSQEEGESILSTNLEYGRYNKMKALSVTEKLNFTYLTITRFLLETGSRINETLSLKVEDVDISLGEAIYQPETTKTKVSRSVFLISPLLKEGMKKLCDGKQGRDLIFTNLSGSKIIPSDFNQDLRKRGEKAGIPPHKKLHAHVLRHTYGTSLWVRTRDIYLVKEVLGHKTIESTMTYVQAGKEIVREGMYLSPWVEKSVDPKFTIDSLKNDLDKRHFEDHPGFDRLKVIKAKNKFIENLHEAIK
jgi:integrase/recombinase XerD